MAGHVLAFLSVAAVLIVTPGPDTALTIRNALSGGRRSGLRTAAGVATGQAIWALFTAAGVAALLRASQPAFAVLRLAGAAYLVWLGLQSLIAAVRASAAREAPADAPVRHADASYRQGLFSNLSNPKMVVFFVTLLPQFTGGHVAFLPMLALGIVFAVMTLAWLSAYAVAVAKAGARLRSRSIRRLIDAATGAVLIGLGLRLAGERR
jgi:RhtB (resistance to homoserine/threonine) family protein